MISPSKERALALVASGNLEKAETELRAALAENRSDQDGFVRLGYLDFNLHRYDDAIPAFETAQAIDPHNRLAAFARSFLVVLYASSGRHDAALDILNRSSESLFTIQDATELGNLWNGSAMLNEVSLAVKFGEAFLKEAPKQGVPPAKVEDVRKYLLDFTPRLIPFAFSNSVPPRTYSESKLDELLNKKFSAEERKFLSNPLRTTEQMRTFAAGLVRAESSASDKAQTLFRAILRRVDNKGIIAYNTNYTSEQVFLQWTNATFRFHCQEATYLFVTFARCVGLSAFVAYVEAAVDGSHSPHMCAAFYDRDQMFLLDPTYCWYGAPHKKFTVLNDAQVVGLHFSAWTSLEVRRCAERLAPSLPVIKYNLFVALSAAGLTNEARRVSSELETLDPGGLNSMTAQAQLALYDGDPSRAKRILESAVVLYPRDAILNLTLGRVYDLCAEPELAAKSYEQVLKSPHTSDQATEIEHLITSSASQSKNNAEHKIPQKN